MRADGMPRLLAALVAGLVALVTSGCSTIGYYSQAIDGQAEILRKARPISVVMADDRVPARVKRKLAVVEDARHFAGTRLELPANHQYTRYTDLGRRYVSWVLFAAPEFSVEGKTWWYPFVGRLEYRGYFSEKDARGEVKRLKAQGLEVYAGGVEAYSTLGVFHDPVLNTFFQRTDAELAEVIFHELTHVKLFLPGDSDFNEAFATANAEMAVRRWLTAKGDRAELARYETSLTNDREVVALLLATREKLRGLYARQDLSPAQMRERKAALLAELHTGYLGIRSQHPGFSLYDRAFTKPWNNARLNTVSTYYDLVPGFERLMAREHGNLHAFYADVEKMRYLSKKERRARLMR
ncbi:aminopeptidase [Chthoniobacter flavus Ellin428]|uniref:Aminopeptidase n=2 Tax=Chthoniobacter flavus TaxID=191863 RepID=B4D3A2_9BACT|nr:aminopeptidase [Chthoniobacter flavus Ellin428]